MATVLRETSQTLKNYSLLTKPGILIGNAINALAGFALAAQNHFPLDQFCLMLTGLLFVIASACIFNNYIDREIDAKMTRTSHRPLAIKALSTKLVLTVATLLACAGLTLLWLLINPLAMTMAAIGFTIYVVMYSFSKHISTHATLIGSVAGSMPPIVGYVALSNQIDSTALFLFLLITFWQMPHFYAIAIYRMEDYRAASIPVLPLKKGLLQTQIHMLLYIIAYLGAACLLAFTHHVNSLFVWLVFPSGLVWLALALQRLKADNAIKWGKQMFRFSLVVVLLACLAILF